MEAGPPVTDGGDRIVHARSKDAQWEVVRYDRQGRWYLEQVSGQKRLDRSRLPTVGDAAREAKRIEDEGGEIFHRLHGGAQFDRKVAGARRG